VTKPDTTETPETTERTDLATCADAPTPAAINTSGTVADVSALLGTFMQLASNPAIDADKLREIRLTVSEATERAKREEFSRSKAAAIREMPIIRKDGRIVIQGKNNEPDRVQGHFERWPDVQRAITPPLRKNNLTLTHRINATPDGRVLVTAILMHDNGYTEESGEMSLPLDTSGGKNNVQGAGSAQSYGMRYSTRAILGLQFEPGHDDGQLIPLPDEPLNDQQQRRVAEAQQLWDKDPALFEEWWGRLQPQDKAWMLLSGRYKEITGREAGRLLARSAGHDPDAPKPEPDPATEQKPRRSERQTPEQWVEQYEAECRRAETLTDLARIQRKAGPAIQRLQDNGLDALYDRVIDAGRLADQRLRTPPATGGDELFDGGDA